MKPGVAQALPGLSPELQAAVGEVLREGESVAAFVEAAVQRLVAQRRAQAGNRAQEPRPAAAPAGACHAADELLMQLEAWRGLPGEARAEAG